MSGIWNSDNDQVATLIVNDLLTPGSSKLATLPLCGHEFPTEDLQAFTSALKSNGVNVTSIQELFLKQDKELYEFVATLVECVVADHSLVIPTEEMTGFKKELVKSMTPEQLAHAILHTHTFKVFKDKDGLVVKSVTAEPLVDLLQLRAQVFTTKGLVLSKSRSVKHHSNVLRRVFELLGHKVVARVPDPLRFSGGDYVAAGTSLAFIGVGPLTDEAAVRFLLSKDAFGTTRVAVVRDLFDRNDNRKTLDSVFKIVSPDCALVAGGILGSENLNRRLVNEYTRCAVDGSYHLTRMSVEFGQYLKEQHFHLIEVPQELHNEVGLPVYNLGLGKLLVADERVATLLTESSSFKGEVHALSLKHNGALEFISHATLLLRKATEGSFVASDEKPLESAPRAIWRPADGVELPRRQTTNSILMVAPLGFQSNQETAVDNYFMQQVSASAMEVEAKALQEFSALHRNLTEAGVTIWLQCAERFHKTPDAVFPNNWFSTHSIAENDGKNSLVAFYPMKTESRRAERRSNIISDMLSAYDKEISFTHWEASDFPQFFESTGVLIMDRVHKVAYCCLSQRCSAKIARDWAKRLGYEMCLFHCTDDQGRPIYHTNVMMSVGTSIAVVCLDSVEDKEERRHLVETLSKTHEILEINREQVNNFCGNVLELKGIKEKDGKKEERKLMLMSTKAYDAFTPENKKKLLEHVDDLVHADLDTIERIGGGGARCMMGEIF